MDLSQRQFMKIAGMIEGCDKKRPYKRLWQAAMSASYHDRPMRAYRCQICAKWHLTSKIEG